MQAALIQLAELCAKLSSDLAPYVLTPKVRTFGIEIDARVFPRGKVFRSLVINWDELRAITAADAFDLTGRLTDLTRPVRSYRKTEKRHDT